MYKFLPSSATLIPGGIAMFTNLIGKINTIKAVNFKPNDSQLSREYGIDRRTVSE